FFFSSRRRHTRSKRDWSSDVCSSDLEALNVRINMALYIFKRTVIYLCQFTLHLAIIFQRLLNVFKFLLAYLCISWHDYSPAKSRSEERRVGKGCRSRWR